VSNADRRTFLAMLGAPAVAAAVHRGPGGSTYRPARMGTGLP
jgi:hypothetical protein